MDPPHINYVNNKSILAINPAGKMRQVFVPFRVQVLCNTKILKENHWVLVEEVQAHDQYKMLYRVASNWWPYNLFRLQINF